jgi:DNA-binding IclR family transcriptional regulator
MVDGAALAEAAPARKRSATPSRSMLNLLRLIEEMMSVDQVGVTTVARRMGIPVATAFRLLKVLEYAGFAEQVADSRQYRLSLKLFEIGCHVAGKVTIRNLAAVEMERLARQTGLAVNLGVLVGSDLLYLDKIQTDDILVLNLPPGMRAPAHSTAMGKAILAFEGLDPKELLGEEPYTKETEYSISTYDEFARDLTEIRRVGFAVDRQELSVGIWCVAAPIIDGTGKVLGAISVSSLRASVEQSELNDLGLQVLATARRIASRAGAFTFG